MQKVEAYRCEECKGKGVIAEDNENAKEYGRILGRCNACFGAKVVWLTVLEALDKKEYEVKQFLEGTEWPTREEIEKLQSDHKENCIRCGSENVKYQGIFTPAFQTKEPKYQMHSYKCQEAECHLAFSTDEIKDIGEK